MSSYALVTGLLTFYAKAEELDYLKSNEVEVTVVEVEIADVVRGPGLPFSLPPRDPGKRDIAVTITPSLSGTVHWIEFDIVGRSGKNGKAEVVENAIRDTSGDIKIKGTKQTASVQYRGRLQIRARIDGKKECSKSTGFTVCAHPLRVVFGGVGPIDGWGPPSYKLFGYVYASYIESDSGTYESKDLDKCWAKEFISTDPNHPPTGWFVGKTLGVGSWLLASEDQVDLIGISGGSVEDFKEAIVEEGVGSEGSDQLMRFGCLRCGILPTDADSALIEYSGFNLYRELRISEGKYYVDTKRTGKEHGGVKAGEITDTSTFTVEIE